MPLDWCGHCPACRAGHKHVCQNLDFVGIDSPGAMQRAGLFPPECSSPAAGSPVRGGAIVEPTAVAVHDVRRAGLQRGEQAVVVGGGPIGLLVACVARAAGADVSVSS